MKKKLLSEDTMMTIKQLIVNQCSKESLCDLCDDWSVMVDEFYEFLDYAFRYRNSK